MTEQPEQPQNVRKQERSNAMALLGVLLLVLGVIGLAAGGSPVALVAALLGGGLLVAGLATRP